jgi:hypothetical protein
VPPNHRPQQARVSPAPAAETKRSRRNVNNWRARKHAAVNRENLLVRDENKRGVFDRPVRAGGYDQPDDRPRRVRRADLANSIAMLQGFAKVTFVQRCQR